MKNLSSKQSVTMILIVITSLFWIEPRAEADLDSATRSALEQTQKVLRDPSTRDKILDSDSTARQNDSKLLQITGGGANQQEIYEIAAVIFESLLSETTGEPAEVEKILNFSNIYNPFRKITIMLNDNVRRVIINSEMEESRIIFNKMCKFKKNY